MFRPQLTAFSALATYFVNSSRVIAISFDIKYKISKCRRNTKTWFTRRLDRMTLEPLRLLKQMLCCVSRQRGISQL
jgi:hypothetical protein